MRIDLSSPNVFRDTHDKPFTRAKLVVHNRCEPLFASLVVFIVMRITSSSNFILKGISDAIAAIQNFSIISVIYTRYVWQHFPLVDHCAFSTFTLLYLHLPFDLQLRDSTNPENRYNHNFDGVYCICKRPYPDPEDTVSDEMLQCIICEDWYHSRVKNICGPF